MSHLKEDALKGWEIKLPFTPPADAAEAQPKWPEYPGAESWPARNGFASQRNGAKITHIGIHGMWGTYEGSLSWFQSANNPYYTSAHYSVSSGGRVGQSVWEHLAAHHLGIHNGYTLGIEHEDFQKMHSNPAWVTDKMLHASAKLVAHLCKKYNILINRQHIKGHAEFSAQDHTDPGKYWPWEKYINLVKTYAGGPVTKPVEVKGQRKVGEIRGETPLQPIAKVQNYAKSKGATKQAQDLITGIYKYAPQRKFGADVLSAQMLLETNYGKYTGESRPYNPAGIKTANATGDVTKDFEAPKTADEGARMLVNHWCAVFGIEPIGVPHGRYAVAKKVYAGKPKFSRILELGNGNWATDPQYGIKITNILDAISKFGAVKPVIKPKFNINYGQWYPHVAAVAREISETFGVNVTTYYSHGYHPTLPKSELSKYGIDIWISPETVRANPTQEALGDRIQKYVEDNWDRFNAYYAIYWGHQNWGNVRPIVNGWYYYDASVYSKGNQSSWVTQGHYDHFHLQIKVI